MATAGLVTYSALSIGAAALYLAISRHAKEGFLFRFWWWGLAAMSATSAIQGLLAAFASDAPWLPAAATASQFVYVFAACVALCGLMCDLMFLHTGKLEASPFFALFYGLVYVAAGASLAWQRVSGFAAHDFAVEVAYANPLPQEGMVYVIFYALLLLPQIFVAAAYLALYRRVGDRQARTRVVLVSTSLLVLLVPTFLVGALGGSHDGRWLAGQQALQLVTSAGVLLAHKPPAWLTGGSAKRPAFLDG